MSCWSGTFWQRWHHFLSAVLRIQTHSDTPLQKLLWSNRITYSTSSVYSPIPLRFSVILWWRPSGGPNELMLLKIKPFSFLQQGVWRKNSVSGAVTRKRHHSVSAGVHNWWTTLSHNAPWMDSVIGGFLNRIYIYINIKIRMNWYYEICRSVV